MDLLMPVAMQTFQYSIKDTEELLKHRDALTAALQLTMQRC